MRIGLYMQPAQMGAEGLHAGLEALGHTPVFRRPLFKGPSDCERFDLVWVLGWKGVHGLIAECYASRKVPALYMDAPWFGPYNEDRWRLSAGDPSWLFPDAPKVRAKEIGALPDFPMATPSDDAEVVLCGQVPGDAAHQISSVPAMIAWAEATMDAIRAQVDRPILWRAHPGAPTIQPSGADGLADGPLAEVLEDAYAVVSESSGVGLDALAQGVPVVATGDPAYRDLAHAVRDLPKIKPPAVADVQALFSRLAYQHWSNEELATGEGQDLFLRIVADKALGLPKDPEPKPAVPPRKKPGPKPRAKPGPKPRAKKGAASDHRVRRS